MKPNLLWTFSITTLDLLRNKKTTHSCGSAGSDVELLDSMFALLIFGLAMVQYFLIIPPFFIFGMGMCIQFHCMFEVCNLPFDFTGAYS